ncbi:N utilization substance protein B [Clostridium algifaecis]|uniref:Transcription antitermination protein NusB n=1 Tax=Clostridium algifaecis TaxID=1472040 RepID=A0ABS4KQ23_9CLOT|nr:transcription antitermination factor NusB [Clostridium algifaecis]MBP2031476.1 N utilization substance protein B [Clostridium algifaecis]
MNRKKSRELAMKLLFQMTINKEDSSKVIENLKENQETESNKKEDTNLKDIDMDYLVRVLKGVEVNRDLIDSKIQNYLKKWKIDRLSKIDITILRICSYEFLYEEDIPKNVSINEAVELAKVYGEDKSANFINGVLGSMIKDVNKA